MVNGKNYIAIGIIVIVIIGIVGTMIALNFYKPNQNDNGLIGGQEDEHGCLIGAGYSWNETKQQCVREWEERSDNYCTVEQKNAEACTQEYGPVCGWYNPSIQCIKYPCAQEYSNRCYACVDDKVEYWTGGNCPTSY